MTLLETIEEVDARIIAIDGRSAAGKTTLAGVLASDLGACQPHAIGFVEGLDHSVRKHPERVIEFRYV